MLIMNVNYDWKLELEMSCGCLLPMNGYLTDKSPKVTFRVSLSN